MTKTISSIMLLIALTFSGTASAEIVNISAQPGFYDISSFLTIINNTASIDIEGTLAPRTSVVFSYALTSMGGSGITNGSATLTGNGLYNFFQNNAGNVVYTPTEGYTHYTGSAFRFALQRETAQGADWGLYGYRSLVLLTSGDNISEDGRLGTFELSNASNAVATYSTQFLSTVMGLQAASYTYQTTALSAVPLPAALPLLGGAMVMLGALRAKRKRS